MRVVCLSVLYKRLAAVPDALADLEHIIVTNIKDYLPFVSRTYFTIARERHEGHRVDLPGDGAHHWWNDLLKESSADDPGISTAVDSLAALQFTAGTTGMPMRVMLSHRNLLIGAPGSG
jgi:long-chain acyl-CoA synthetase